MCADRAFNRRIYTADNLILRTKIRDCPYCRLKSNPLISAGKIGFMNIFRKLFLITAIAAAAQNAQAQEKFDVGVHMQHAQFSDRSMQAYGLQFHFPFNDDYTLNYTFGIGGSSLGGHYVRSSAGMATGLFLISSFGSDSTKFGHKIVSVAGFFAMFVPEGIGYYFNPGSKWRMHLNVNPLLVDYWKRKEPYFEQMRLGGEIMLRVKHPIAERFYVAPQAGVKLRYRGGYVGGMIGFTVGLQMNDD